MIETVIQICTMIKAHIGDIFAVIGFLISAATIIVKITPTQKDDAVLAKIVKILDYLSVVNPNGTEVISKEEAD